MSKKIHLKKVNYFGRYGLLLVGTMLLFVGCLKVQPPWSGWWWPMTYTNTCGLYNTGGPADKYDQYVKVKTGVNPGFAQWEKLNHGPKYPNTNMDRVGWSGHCHALAAASILYKEPDKSIKKLGVTFDILDLKALLTEAHYQFNTALNVGTRYNGPNDDLNDPSPDKFHKVLRDYLYDTDDPGWSPFALDIDAKESVNTHIAYNYYIKKQETDLIDPNITHLTTVVYYVDYGPCQSNYVGTVTSEITYTYWLKGPIDSPTSGGWEGSSLNNHPDFLWIPNIPLAVPGRPANFLFTVGEIGQYKKLK